MPKAYQGSDPFASESFRSLREFVEGRVRGGEDDAGDFEQFERDLHTRVAAFEAGLVAAYLSRFDEEAPEVEVSGELHRRKERYRKEYCTLAGTVTVERTLYIPQGGGKAVCPLELRVGMIEGYWTPHAARVAARAVAGSTPREVAELFEEIGGMKPSASSLDRLPKRLSEHWEESRDFLEDEMRAREVIPAEAVSVGVSLAGVLVPMRKREAEDKGAETAASDAAEVSNVKGPEKAVGPEGYREVGCGTVTLYDAQGEPLQTIRYARAPEYKKATLKSQLEAELESILRARPELDLITLSDGAQDHWEFLDELPKRLGVSSEKCPEKAKRALDMYHALERIKEALDAYHGEGTSAAKAAFEECRIWLREEEDGAERVLRALRHRRNNRRGKKREAIAKQIKYLAKRKALMRYKQLLDSKLPVGSGIVEAACKTLASERMKRSGMRWEEGTQGILTLRSLIQSRRWSSGWELVASQYKAHVEVPQARRAA